MRMKKFITIMFAVVFAISCLSVFASANDLEPYIDDVMYYRIIFK